MSVAVIIALVCGGVVLLGIVIACALFASHIMRHRYDERKEERARLAEEQKRNQNTAVSADNPFLCAVTRAAHIIMVKGVAGSGKTVTLSLLSRWLANKRLAEYASNYRYNKYVKPQVIHDFNKRIDAGHLPFVASSFMLSDEQGLISDSVWPYLEQQKKAIEGQVLVIDETADKLGKDKYHQAYKDKDLADRLRKIKDTGEYIRHYFNGYLILADQEGNDVYSGLRQMGGAVVTAHQTVVTLSKRGKTLRKVKQWLLRYLPACYTTSLADLYTTTLNKRLRTVLKSLFVPLYKLRPTEYYTRKNAINKEIKDIYTEYRLLLEFNGWYQWLIFNNSDLYRFESRHKKAEYLRKFSEV